MSNIHGLTPMPRSTQSSESKSAVHTVPKTAIKPAAKKPRSVISEPVDENPDADQKLYTCSRCPEGEDHPIKEMGVRVNGTLSSLCKYHFDLKREYEAGRAPRDRAEEYKERDARPERQAAKKDWWANNKEKRNEYMRRYRAKKRKAAADDETSE